MCIYSNVKTGSNIGLLRNKPLYFPIPSHITKKCITFFQHLFVFLLNNRQKQCLSMVDAEYIKMFKCLNRLFRACNTDSIYTFKWETHYKRVPDERRMPTPLDIMNMILLLLAQRDQLSNLMQIAHTTPFIKKCDPPQVFPFRPWFCYSYTYPSF